MRACGREEQRRSGFTTTSSTTWLMPKHLLYVKREQEREQEVGRLLKQDVKQLLL
jgi:hypothetical protein